jgi:FMN reductase
VVTTDGQRIRIAYVQYLYRICLLLGRKISVRPAPNQIVYVVGNPRPESRTLNVAHTLATELAGALDMSAISGIDLATLGPRVLAAQDAEATAAVAGVLAADLLIVASPTYKATYSGLLKAFLDRIATGALQGKPAIPVLLGGAPNHQLAVDVHLTPLLFELGATVPARGLFVLEQELDVFGSRAAIWAQAHRAVLAAAIDG